MRQGFVKVTHVRCPDCEARGALRNDGGAKVLSGRQLRPATTDVGVTTAAAGCRTCKGKGSIQTDDHESLLAAGVSLRRVDLDPYSHPLTPEQVAKKLARGRVH